MKARTPDRDAQFEYINTKVVAAQAQDQPVISVDTKKKELVGNLPRSPGKKAAGGTSRSALS